MRGADRIPPFKLQHFLYLFAVFQLGYLLQIRLWGLALCTVAIFFMVRKLESERSHYIQLIRESQEAKNQFIANLSHEVKTPITSLLMATRFLKKSIQQFSNPVHQELIQNCVNDVDRLRILIDELLSASRVDTSFQDQKNEQFNFFKIMKKGAQRGTHSHSG